MSKLKAQLSFSTPNIESSTSPNISFTSFLFQYMQNYSKNLLSSQLNSWIRPRNKSNTIYIYLNYPNGNIEESGRGRVCNQKTN